MDYIIRLENTSDHREVENVTREAFWNLFQPGCDEHFLVHELRKCDTFVPALDMVVLDNYRIIGNIMYSKCHIISTDATPHEILTFGPLSILPSRQKRGIGAYLVRHSIAEAKRLGYGAIAIYGWPEYYQKFGFKKASNFGIVGKIPGHDDALQILELKKGYLKNRQGILELPAVYNVDVQKAEEFDRTFSAKEKGEPLFIR